MNNTSLSGCSHRLNSPLTQMYRRWPPLHDQRERRRVHYEEDVSTPTWLDSLAAVSDRKIGILANLGRKYASGFTMNIVYLITGHFLI